MTGQAETTTRTVQHTIQISAGRLRVAVGIAGLVVGLFIEFGSPRILVSATAYLIAALAFSWAVRRGPQSDRVILLCLLIDIVAATHAVLAFGPTHTVLVAFYPVLLIGYSLLSRKLGALVTVLSALGYGIVLLIDVTGIFPHAVLEPYRAGAYRDPVLLTGIYLIFLALMTGAQTLMRITMSEMERRAKEREQLTEAKQAAREAAIREKAADAQRLESLGRLACGVAHDFNNLLTVILGYGGELKRRLADNEGAQYRLDQIVAAAERATSLTRQLLAFGRHQPLRTQAMDVNDALKAMRDMLERTVGEHLVVEFALDARHAVVNADPTQFQQIVANLVVNARDAMPAGGSLRVATRNVSISTALHDTPMGLPPDQYVQLTVEDSGVGMDEATQARIFEPFFTTKPAGTGTGLGLSTAYGIVRQSGGVIEVESAPGRGTTFRVWLPMTDGRPEKEPVRPSDGPAGTETVLLAEDEAPLREMTAEILRQHGYRVIDAQDGAECLRMASQVDAPDLLVTDVVMPGMSGKALADQLRAAFPGMKVLFITGYAPDPVLRDWQEDDAAPILEKPFAAGDLLYAVRAALDERTAEPA